MACERGRISLEVICSGSIFGGHALAIVNGDIGIHIATADSPVWRWRKIWVTRQRIIHIHARVRVEPLFRLRWWHFDDIGRIETGIADISRIHVVIHGVVTTGQSHARLQIGDVILVCLHDIRWLEPGLLLSVELLVHVLWQHAIFLGYQPLVSERLRWIIKFKVTKNYFNLKVQTLGNDLAKTSWINMKISFKKQNSLNKRVRTSQINNGGSAKSMLVFIKITSRSNRRCRILLKLGTNQTTMPRHLWRSGHTCGARIKQ